MFVAIIPLRHLHKPQRAADGYEFDCADMRKFVRQLRECRVGDEVELTPLAWVERGNPPVSLAMLVGIAGDLAQFHQQCEHLKITLLPAGTRDDPADLADVVAKVGMIPIGGFSHAVR